MPGVKISNDIHNDTLLFSYQLPEKFFPSLNFVKRRAEIRATGISMTADDVARPNHFLSSPPNHVAPILHGPCGLPLRVLHAATLRALLNQPRQPAVQDPFEPA